MEYRDHTPIPIDNFQGLYQRGDPGNCPMDHFTDCNNIINKGNNITVRPGVGVSQTVAVPLEDIRRMYNFNTTVGNTLLVLTYDEDADEGKIYHVVNATTVFLILTIDGMTDFAFYPYAGRAYLSPFSTFVVGDLNIEKGLQNEFVYVYKGDGTQARKAAGAVPAGTITVANGAAGHTDAGMHVFAFVGESDSGFLSEPFGYKAFNTLSNFSVSFGAVPVMVGAQWTKRHLVATHVIPSYNGNTQGYQFFFVPDATINNNTDIFLNNISFFDNALLEDASHLIDNFAEIPAGAVLGMYHERLCVATTFNDISLVMVSAEGEPEAISEIDGELIVYPDANPITNIFELRDIMYVFKRARTIGYADNGEEPSNWKGTIVDNALGCPVHGIATVLDSGGSTVDFLMTASFAGILLFNGKYFDPALTWKVEQLWKDLDRNEFRKIQIINAVIQKWIVVVLPDGTLLVGDYSNGMDPKKLKWFKWAFNMPINCLAIVNIDEIVIGSPIFVET